MFFFLSKFLPLLIYPLGLTLILLVVAVLVWRWRRWQTAVLTAIFLLLYLASNTPVSLALARSLEWRYFPPDPLPQADVIVVLGGGNRWADPPQPVPNLNDAGDRMLYAAWLYRQGVADHLLLTGGRLPGATSSDAAEMAKTLHIMGIPNDALWLEDASLNTYQNALFSRQFLAEKGIDRIVLVTSALHMPRSVAIFEKQGFQVIPAPTDYFAVSPAWDEESRPQPAFRLLDLLPTASALELTTRVLKEYLGIFIYGLRGWL